jgi:hypothetical protein
MHRLVPLLTLVAAPVVHAQDVVSGPEKGAAVPALQVFDVTGAHQGQSVDYAAERKDKATVFVLLRADRFDRPMNRFLKGLDQAVQKDFPEVYIVAVWLTEDEQKSRELLPRVQQSVHYQATALTVLKSDGNGPKGWNLNGDAHLTVVLAVKGRVAATFAYRSVNETDVPAVRDALKKALDGK